MSGKIVKFAIKVAAIVWLIGYIYDRLASAPFDGYLIPIAILVFGLALLKHWFPALFNFLKRSITWLLKTTGGWLWRKREKKGGASVRQPRMRWRA